MIEKKTLEGPRAIITGIWSRIASEPKPVRFVLSRILRKTGASILFSIARDGYKLRFFPTALSTTLWYQPSTRKLEERLISALLRDGDLFLDVGANIGTMTLAAATKLRRSGHVIAIEAHPKTFTYLEKNIALNGFTNVTLYNLAASDKEGVVLFSSRYSDDQNAVANKKDSIKVPSITLDSLILPDHNDLCLKLDVEGYELCVLRGANNILSKSRSVFFEAGARTLDAYGTNFGALREIFTLHGLKLFGNDGGVWKEIDATFVLGEVQDFIGLRNPSDIAAVNYALTHAG